VFFTSNLASHTEIIAILSSGTSYRRFLWPYVMGSAMIAVMIFGLIGWVIPKSNKTRLNFEHTYLRSQFYFEGRNVHIKTAPTTYIYLESYNNIIKTGYQFTMEEIEGRQLKKKIKANRISWNVNNNSWTLEYYTIHTFNGMKESISSGYNKDTVFNLKPQDFETRDLNFETFTLTELNDFINILKSRGADNVETYLIDLYERIAYPFAIIILALMGAISASKKSRGGTSLQIAFGFFMAFVYIILVTMSRSIGKAGSIPPIWAAWTPNLIFLVVGYIMYLRVPK
jgi:lipopolysaccharide export system permease protein